MDTYRVADINVLQLRKPIPNLQQCKKRKQQKQQQKKEIQWGQ